MATCKQSASRAFSIAFDANVDEIQAAGRQRRKVMHEAWEDIDKGWQALQQRLIEVGIAKNSNEEGVLRLNVGGSHVNLCLSILSKQGSSETRTLALLFNREWDKRLPRDGDGFMVLDESSTCVKHILHKLLDASISSASGTADLALLGDGLPPDEQAYLPHVFRALGLRENRSIVLEPGEFGPTSATILNWCPGKPCGLELVYRASRDGWDGQAFHARCGDDSPSTVTLFRVSGAGPGSRHSVVGGFSSVPWTVADKRWKSSPGAFVFMLKDGSSTGSTTFKFKPVKGGLKEGSGKKAVFCDHRWGPSFGESLEMTPNEGLPGALQTENHHYDTPAEGAFLALKGRDVVEIETFRVVTPKPEANLGLVDVPKVDVATMSAEGGRAEDVRNFGVSIADSFMEERIALRRAHDQLAEANTKAAEAFNALVAVYGPLVAEGKEDDVVELSVRGTRMTTLRSTLQACPDSALATQFDEEKWPATEKDMDGRGRRVMNCSPSVFSKVLDVLRMRKRAGWAVAEGCSESDVNVVVNAADRAAFDEFVDKYFPGCESFIMDFVADAPNEPKKSKKRKAER